MNNKRHFHSALAPIRAPRFPLRVVTGAVVALFLNAILLPSWAVAAELARHNERQAEIRWEKDNERLDQVLVNLKHASEKKKRVLDERVQSEVGLLDDVLAFINLSSLSLTDTADINKLAARLKVLAVKARKDLRDTGAELRAKGVPDVILARQAEAEAQFDARHQALMAAIADLQAAETVQDQAAAMTRVVENYSEMQVEQPRDHFDPEAMPWGTPDPSTTRKPAKSAAELSQNTGVPLFEEGVQVASNIITPDMLGNPGGPTEDDLVETIDAQQTDAIIAKAAELNHDPVEIYQWVRNNIEFIPSYGSIQGADYTLQNLKGNGFDTASLLIALLRAANVPARYAFGTVEMPAEAVMNWVGGVNVPKAAGNLMLQGGIPTEAIAEGGVIKRFQLEHVWVEAWIDYAPSRGEKHIAGDSWVPMDASYKQYDYNDGMDLATEVPFDAQGLADTITAQSTINEAEGWVQGVPQADVEAALTDYRAQLETFLEQQAPDATVGEVLGTRTIKTVVQEALASTLPYSLITRKLVTSELADDVRWKFRYVLSDDAQGSAGAQLLSMEQPTVALAGQKLALSFKPATPADEDLLTSYLPEPGANGEIDPEAIPDTLPGYMIQLSAEFALGDALAASSSTTMALGEALISDMGYWQPGRGWQTSRNEPVAGEFRAIALDLQGISAPQAQALQAELEATQAKLGAEDYTDLTKQQLVGDLLYSTILSYFALNGVQDSVSERQANSVGYRAPSYGLFKTTLVPQYWYGVPQSVTTTGLGMDVDRFYNLRVDKENDSERWQAFNRAQGARMSAMEHLVPEQMYSTEDTPANGISAAKAIQLAAAEGQRIWTITQRNVDLALNQIELGEFVENDIRNSVAAGMEVTCHEESIDFSGSLVSGYLILNPSTGTGAYKIGTGENGSELAKQAYVALGLLGTAVQSGTTITEAILRLLNLLDPVFKAVARGVLLLGLIQTVLETAFLCSSSDHVFGMMFMSVLLFLFTAILAFAFTPLVGILVSVIMGQAASSFMSFIRAMDDGCVK